MEKLVLKRRRSSRGCKGLNDMTTNILDRSSRQQIITDITLPEERKRRQYHQKAQEIFQDEVRVHLVAFLRQEFQEKTIGEMRLTDLNVVKKVVNRLSAPIYKRPPRRESKDNQEGLDQLLENTQFQQNMIRLVKFWRLHKNAVQYTRAIFSEQDGGTIIKMNALAPHQYSVKVNPKHREDANVYILSLFADRDSPALRTIDEATTAVRRKGDETKGKVETNAIDDEPESTREFVFWTKDTTLATLENGLILGEDLSGQFLNPIARLPFSLIADSRDGEFWAQGGRDLTEGTIMVNAMLSDAATIAKIHGFKIMVMSGSARTLPNLEQIGITKAIRLQYDKDEDPTPDVSFVGGDANISQHVKMAIDYLQLLLSTNGLKAAGVDGVEGSASGLAKMMDEAELTENTEEAMAIVRDVELDAIDVMVKWHNWALQNISDYVWKDLGLIDPEQIAVTFPVSAAPAMSSAEVDSKVKQLDKGLTSKKRVIRELNPGITDDEIDELLKEIADEKQEGMERMSKLMGEGNGKISKEKSVLGQEEEEERGEGSGEEERKKQLPFQKEEKKEE